jgi:gentisate 1,2-dioxygenase
MIGERTDAAREQFYADLDAAHLEGLWRVPMPTPEPRTAVEPYVWRWDVVRAMQERAADLVTIDRAAERRTLELANPGLKGRAAATHTLIAAVQMLRPGEVAPPHRHTPSAIRFVIRGDGAYTTVEGEKIVMHPGDLILTPNWTWHDHGNETDAPVIWMDGLDVPLVHALNSYFIQFHPDERQPLTRAENYSAYKYAGGHVRPAWERAAPPHSPQRLYRWADTYAALAGLADVEAASPFDDVAVDYVNPLTGGHALPTLGCTLQLLRPGVRTRAHRHNSSAVYHVFRGHGYSVIGGRRYDWAEGDFLALPSWAWHEHANGSTTDEAILFSITDVPVMEALALYREEAYAPDDGHQAGEQS